MTAPYHVGWAVTGRDDPAHLVATAAFPLAGSRHTAWCGARITVVALCLDVRSLPATCPDCRALATGVACEW